MFLAGNLTAVGAKNTIAMTWGAQLNVKLWPAWPP
jgi:hypothetical protein